MKLKVLFILLVDVYNIPALKIAEEMLHRGYQIDFYAMSLEKIHIRMFEGLNVKIEKFSNLNISTIEQYDFIYSACSMEALPVELLDLPKYFFHFTTTPLDEPNGYGDFTFTQRDMNLYFQDEHYRSFEKIKQIKSSPGKSVGNPKFDFDDIKEIQEKKQILFVDAGHFPFGEKGKMEVAEMLLSIADHFPDYTVVIKPRFLPQDKTVTHRNNCHLYDCLKKLTNGNLPYNINCIDQHVDLEEKVRESEVVITLAMSSTYLDIGAYRKKGLVVTGLSCEQNVIMSEMRKKRLSRIVERSGLCVPYTEVLANLPEGKQFSKEHLIEMGLDKKNVSRNIVDTMETVYSQYIVKGCYPTAEDTVLTGERCIKLQEVISLRYVKRLFSYMEPIKSRIEELDFKEVEDYIFLLLKDSVMINGDNFLDYCDIVSKKVNNVLLNNKNILMRDSVKQCYYLKAVYDKGEIQYEKEDDYDAKAMYFCLMGKHKIIIEKKPEEALLYFERYFAGIAPNKHEVTLAETTYYIESATYWSGVCHFDLGDHKKAKEYFEQCEVLTDDQHKKAKEYLLLLDQKK